ncbi:exonuclease domain-containing protein [Hellea balneolensis]|uniref:exonuclease domain-containing protein n=1 Tax=Hellea balneolensis TaxID=287478 RepID=UPI000419E5C8|nr:exonuclease domain-containing protein [Hellea balneolensis]
MRPQRQKRALPDLPQYYYHTNFCEMLKFVAERYEAVVQDEQKSFLKDFAALPVPAQCLYARLAGRKGAVFSLEKLSYAEIPHLKKQATILRELNFVSAVAPENYASFLMSLSKTELIAFLMKHVCASAYRVSWKKAVLVDAALTHIPYSKDIIDPHYIVQSRQDALNFCLFLYFGKIETNLQNFTMRDLGLIKTPDFKEDYGARFETSQEAQAAYFYASALHDFKHGTEADITALIDSVDNWPAPICPVSTHSRDKLLQKLGGLAERLEDISTALSLYERSDTPLCNERVIRIRYRQGEKEWSEKRLLDLIDNPGSDEEHNFAQDFYSRKFQKKRTSLVTDILRGGDNIKLDEAYRNQPEAAAKRYYEAKGQTVYRTENAMWRMLFGLLFWEELYGDSAAGLYNSFERIPALLKSGDFYTHYKDAIELKLKHLSKANLVLIDLLKVISRHHNTPNGIFRWNGRTVEKVKTLLFQAPPDSLSIIMRLMVQNYNQMKDGFPDLMCVENGHIRFVEIKAEGDVIRRNQLTRIQQLRQAGFETQITRIDWVLDPDQIYVVVDVETTGGRAGLHRLTEIGAVKVQSGKVIGEWQSLLNPQRSIPANITRLTGITQDMVREAPLFHEVADSFRDFMGDAIFAAHNVNFDYGFIASEYKRLGQKFRHPKICTCASMRKLYSGYRSYSLKNLCQEFEIDLTGHHRALCDAKAAAELLKLINTKRLELQA